MRYISVWCVRLATLYVLAGMVLGIVMAATNDHTLSPVHAHTNLLGWVTLALFGLIYRSWPAMTIGKLPPAQVILLNIGIVIQMTGISMLLLGSPETGGGIAGIGSVIIIASILIFIFLVFRRTSDAR
jgi:hypothetical protein